MADLVGQQLGRYHLVRLIGQGGFADVYLGEHIHLNTRAAIKVLQMRLVGSSMEQFRNEARTIASLVHPNIIRVLDFGVENGIPFLIMDSDRSLDKLRPERGISRRTVVVGLGIVGLGACGGVSAWAATGGLQKTLRALGLLNAPTPTPTTPTTLPQPDPSPRPAPPVGSLLQTYRGHTRSLWTAAWSPDGKRIASGGDDGTVQIW